MLPYKSINIPNFDIIQQQFLKLMYEVCTDFTTTNTKILPYETVISTSPELKSFLDDNNLQWEIGRIFITAPFGFVPIHSDSTEEYPKFLALNFPLYGCENTLMQWWENIPLLKKYSPEGYGTNFDIFDHDSDQKILTGALELTSPHLVQVNLPHNVTNNKEDFRAIMSLRFKPNPVHLWWRLPDSNRSPSACKADALPDELNPQLF